MATTHYLSRNRVVAQLELDEHRRPVAVVILLDTGDRVRIDAPADLARRRDVWTTPRPVRARPVA